MYYCSLTKGKAHNVFYEIVQNRRLTTGQLLKFKEMNTPFIQSKERKRGSRRKSRIEGEVSSVWAMHSLGQYSDQGSTMQYTLALSQL